VVAGAGTEVGQIAAVVAGVLSLNAKLACHSSRQSVLMSVRHATCCESGSSVVIGSNLRMHLGGFLAPQREACFGAAAPHTSSCV
jgi:hypothetical protein